MVEYKLNQIGAKFTTSYRLYFKDHANKIVSPFHDIPLFSSTSDDSNLAQSPILNMIVEIPRWSNAKLEISRELAFNPIIQDVKNNKVRFVRNCFPHHGYIWNYGALPQTWESPKYVNPDTKCKGDNDPLDVLEIGERVAQIGELKQVKVLGVMCLIDDDETDWKLISIDIKDKLAPKLNNIEDVETHFPGLLRATNEWFRIYKIPDGKKENKFAFSGEAKNKAYAMKIVRECHEHWKELCEAKTKNEYEINLANTTLENSFSVDEKSDIYKSVPSYPKEEDATIDEAYDKWFFFSGSSNI